MHSVAIKWDKPMLFSFLFFSSVHFGSQRWQNQTLFLSLRLMILFIFFGEPFFCSVLSFVHFVPRKSTRHQIKIAFMSVWTFVQISLLIIINKQMLERKKKINLKISWHTTRLKCSVSIMNTCISLFCTSIHRFYSPDPITFHQYTLFENMNSWSMA